MFELNAAFKKINDVMTSLQKRSADSKMSDVERDEIVLNLSRSLWNLHIARHHVEKMDEENKSLNLASAPRSTEIIASQDMLQQMKLMKMMGLWSQMLK